MSEKRQTIVLQTGKSAKIIKWKVKTGMVVTAGSVILLYETHPSSGEAGQQKLKSASVGTIKTLLAKEGDIIKPGEPLFEVEKCTHPTIMKDMCAECGADLRNEEGEGSSEVGTIPMVHSIPELKVNEEQAQIIGKADEDRLLAERKLVLLVDLDQTLIHTTNDNIPPNLKDVYHFQLHGAQSPWYHTRLRPGTGKFLIEMSKIYELHICTFGSRTYAHMIAMFLDPDGKFFSHRILSRDECFSANCKTANLKALFPCGDSLVCIIDDREDVWSFVPNLIHVKPYHFFQHTGDINAPPGLSKRENDDVADYDFNCLGDGQKYEDEAGGENKDLPNKKNVKENRSLNVREEPITGDEDSTDVNQEKFSQALKIEQKDEANKEEGKAPLDESKNKSQNKESDENAIEETMNETEEKPVEIVKESLGETEKPVEVKEDSGEVVENSNKSESSVQVKENSVESQKSVQAKENSDETEISSQTKENLDETEISAHTKGNSDGTEISAQTNENSDGTEISAQAKENSDGTEISAQAKENSDGTEISAQAKENSDGTEISAQAKENSDGTEISAQAKENSDGTEKVVEDIKSSDPEKSEEVGKSENTPNGNKEDVSMDCVENGPISVENKERDSSVEKKVSTEVGQRIETLSGGSKVSKASDEIDVQDADDYLLYLEEILKSIHKEFYVRKEAGEMPDLKQIVPEIKARVLKGTSLVFSGLVPNHIQLEHSRAYQVAVSLGANVTQDLIKGTTTHLVAVRPGTAKVNSARRMRNIFVVTADWLWTCAERWERVDEKVFPLGKNRSGTRHPPAHCSPEHPPPETQIQPAVRTRSPSGRFMDTINPLLSFSSADIADMDQEVEDIFNESESDGDEEGPEAEADAAAEGKDRPNKPTRRRKRKPQENLTDADKTKTAKRLKQVELEAESESSSSSADSLSGEHPRGWRQHELRREARAPAGTGTESDPEDDLEESPSSKFRRGEALPSDLDLGEDESASQGSDEPPDEVDDGDWNMMGAALEREFLS